MLVAAAVCPHPPLLLPGLSGASDVARDLRTHCAAAVSASLDGGVERVVVVTGGDTTACWPTGARADTSTFRGAPADPAVRVLPLGLAVGRSLLDAAGWTGVVELQVVARDEPAERCAALGASLSGGRTALLVMGDGSARRGPKAPGYVDERAHAFDAEVTRALASGDAAALLGLDAGLAGELLVAGRAPWQVLAGAAGAARVEAEVLLADDPFGVWYIVARWIVARRVIERGA
jgi:hypothetical protein